MGGFNGKREKTEGNVGAGEYLGRGIIAVSHTVSWRCVLYLFWQGGNFGLVCRPLKSYILLLP